MIKIAFKPVSKKLTSHMIQLLWPTGSYYIQWQHVNGFLTFSPDFYQIISLKIWIWPHKLEPTHHIQSTKLLLWDLFKLNKKQTKYKDNGADYDNGNYTIHCF
jgi:hypothetical protein